ncbi:SEL1-like repeat protein [Pantoea cypripedii]|uniref:Sel1 repeat family protein n=1 Tax=Pantoea cypripedii TaxID=55209 RepID=A0A6B9GAI7_PANCY|nr:tetratricopeptide repeat protein [Pantoea cypripedii]QGY32823.1 sel1 repeat family protein [Pantoea cypripedii]
MKLFTPKAIALLVTLCCCSASYAGESLADLQTKATNGDAAAQTTLGIDYLNGDGVTQDYGKAQQWLEKAVAQDSQEACHALALMYTYGQGVTKDLNKAVELYKKAGPAQHGDAYNNLAVIYSKGLNGKADPALAMKYYQLAADAGNSESQAIIGWKYATGDGVAKNTRKAFQYYEKSAAQGNSQGQYLLATAYDDGTGVKRNDALAVSWYKKAADNGNTSAMNNLGVMLTDGEGVKRDYVKARFYLEQAVAKDSAEARAGLGYLYLNGLGVKKDYYKATELYSTACDREVAGACDTVKDMKAKKMYRVRTASSSASAPTQRLIAKSIDDGVNATFTWQGDDATFKANGHAEDCSFLKDFSEPAGNLATSFVCTGNVQIVLKQFKTTKNAYIAVTTNNFKDEVKSFAVNVYTVDAAALAAE